MIWLVGHRGMLGSEVEARLAARGIPHVSSDLEVDIGEMAALRDFVRGRTVSLIVNCSAYTAVDRAEDEPEAAFRVNAAGPENLARVAGETGARLIHVSTDYVFDGTKEGVYTEEDVPHPTGVYGESKLEGERRIRAWLPERSFILRTAWLYGLRGQNFVSTMLRLFRERDEVRVVADQWGTPTLADDLAEAILRVAGDDGKKAGIYHFTNEGKTNWFGFAREIYRGARERGLVERDVRIVPVTTDQYPTRARRPADACLSKEKIKAAFGLRIRPWEDALADFLAALRRER